MYTTTVLQDMVYATSTTTMWMQFRQLRCIRPYLDLKTASTIATAIVHSKLDYCNLLYYDLPEY